MLGLLGGGRTGAGQLVLQALVPVLQLVERLLQAQEGGLQLTDTLLVILWGRVQEMSDGIGGWSPAHRYAAGHPLGMCTGNVNRRVVWSPAHTLLVILWAPTQMREHVMTATISRRSQETTRTPEGVLVQYLFSRIIQRLLRS